MKQILAAIIGLSVWFAAEYFGEGQLNSTLLAIVAFLLGLVVEWVIAFGLSVAIFTTPFLLVARLITHDPEVVTRVPLAVGAWVVTQLKPIFEQGASTATREAARQAVLAATRRNVVERIDALKALIPAELEGRITMAAAVVEDSNGVRSVLVASSEREIYIRPALRSLVTSWVEKGEARVVSGAGHAEEKIIADAQANNLKVISIGATRPICSVCASVIQKTGADIATALKG
jgi:hypothetical protein